MLNKLNKIIIDSRLENQMASTFFSSMSQINDASNSLENILNQMLIFVSLCILVFHCLRVYSTISDKDQQNSVSIF